MTRSTGELRIEHDAPIRTWFGVGGGADRLARPISHEQVREAVRLDPDCRVLGEGANLLVDDAGVGELVLDMKGMRAFDIDADARLVRADAGADLARVIHASVREGLAGLEALGGIPATIGGAVVMNAGGRYGEIGPLVSRVRGIDSAGADIDLDGNDIEFGYRHSGLGQRADAVAGRRVHVITEVELRLGTADRAALRDRLKQIMLAKKDSQPLAQRSAGCVFKNPTLSHDLEGIGRAGERIGAGLLIDRAGGKGLECGGARVSHRHANFIVVDRDADDAPVARAADVIELIGRAASLVREQFGVELEPEVVIWRRERRSDVDGRA